VRYRHLGLRMGITRLADVTGLDYLGVPVVMACRPNARSLSVSQGKGLTLDAALASGFMEAAETFHAEHVELPITLAPRAELVRQRPVVELRFLPKLRGRRVTDRTELPWIEARNLFDGSPAWIPYDFVHTDYREPRPRWYGYFPVCSNGLASGNHRLEALCAGLCEVIERDATSLWWWRPRSERAGRRLDLASVDNPAGRELINRLEATGIMLSVWDVTSDVGIAAFLCRIREAPENPRPPLRAFFGAGCHLARGVALVRAITEAVQTRLTYISGSRDDLERHEFKERADAKVYDLASMLWERQASPRRFEDVPDSMNSDFDADLAEILACLRGVGIDQAYAVDLTRPDLGIPVVRVLVPDLEFIDDMPDYVPGPRARRLQGEAR
jgi:ribosomal protein S12 methylthiotransferase accessory factor